MTRRWLFVLALLLAVGSDILSLGSAEAQRTWPSDSAGRPAPPCTTYDPLTNVVSFCTGTVPLPVTTISGASGAGNPTGSLNDPLGWGRSLFESTEAFDPRSGVGGTSFRWDDATTLTVVRRTAATTIQRWISTDRGQTYQLIGTNAVGGFAGMGPFAGSLIRLQNGLFVTNLAGGGIGGTAFATASNLLSWNAGTGAQIVTTGVTTFAGGPVSLSPNTANRVIGTRANATAATCAPVLSTNGSAYVTTLADQPCAGSVIGSANYVGGTTWLWSIPGSGATFRSVDDGATWSAVASPGANVNAAVCVPPTNAPSGGLGYCLVARGAAGVQSIWRTTDAGTSWTNVIPTVPAAVVNLWLSFTDYGSNILGLITDSNGGVITLWRSNDAGLTWSPAATVTYTGGSTPTAYFQGTPLSAQRAAGSPSNGQGSAVWMPDGAANQNPMYGAALAPGQSQIVGSQGIPWTVDRAGRGAVTNQQAITLANTQTTAAANTAVVVTLTGVIGERWLLHGVDARCSAGTSGLTVESPAGTTIWSTQAAQVTTTNFNHDWNTSLTANTGIGVVITLATCGVGNTGILIVQSSRQPAP